MKTADVTIVLNMHREGLFLRPALNSLDECAQEAANAGIAVELVAVFDRPDQPTLDTFHDAPLHNFCSVHKIVVDVGSLGLARNAGLELASGDYVWTADGDDLVSRNALVELIRVARHHADRDVAIFLEYLVAFGEQYHVARYTNSAALTIADFLYQNPYTSRIFARRGLLQAHKYNDLKVTSGFAYEDWDLNVRLFGAGVDFLVAPDTVLFYRQRPQSLLRQANAVSARLIPQSAPLAPARYIELVAAGRASAGDWEAFCAARRSHHPGNLAGALMSSTKVAGFIQDACSLDPEIAPELIAEAGTYSPVPPTATHWAYQLEKLYDLVGITPFDDIVLLPWLRPGGAEKYILNTVEALASESFGTRVLVVAGEPSNAHEWVRLLPPNYVFLDLCNTFPFMESHERDSMITRAILALSRQHTRLHVKASVFTHRLIDAYGAVLGSCCRLVYYRFCDVSYTWRGRHFEQPWAYSWLRRNLSHISTVLADCQYIVNMDRQRLGSVIRKYQVLYNHCAIRETNRSVAPTFKLLWASRIAAQKRPELIGPILEGVRTHIPQLSLDVFGSVDEIDGVNHVAFGDGLRYRGPFDGLQKLDLAQYDAFIYTSAYDGLPNVVLEALGSALPVVAPDICGIGEAVINEITGFLVPNLTDDKRLVEAYVAAIRNLYANWEAAQEMAKRGQNLIRDRHGASEFAKTVRRILLQD